MKKLLLLCLFVIGLGIALFNFQGLAAKGTFESIVLDFRENVANSVLQQDIQAIAQQYHVEPHLNSKFSIADHVYIIKGDAQVLAALKKSTLAKDTEFIEPNYIYSLPTETATAAAANPAFTGPNDPLYSQQWNFHSIGMTAAWAQTKGQGATVAVIDTGISRTPDLEKTGFVTGYDFVNDKEQADDDNGHGTHVAGTIAQSTNNNYGTAGIAYEAKLMPLKVLADSGGGTVADIAEAIRFAADNGAHVINMSLGGGGESQLMREAIDHAHAKGVVVIGAAGNSNDNAASYPARYPHVIGVAALDASATKAPYSNFGAGVDISAPGGGPTGGILQETIDPETQKSVFTALQGTSMAAPHVAGGAALVKASGIKDPSEVLTILQKSALPVADDNLNYYGAGKLDAAAAVKLASQKQISFPDFFRWLSENGYLNLGFWFDGGVVALLPKIGMIVGSYLLAWFLRVYFPFTWGWSLTSGLIAGSSGLFFLKGFYIFDLPQWPFRVLGSSIPELGNAVNGASSLNPLFASVLIPLGLIALLLGHPSWKWFAVGSALGVASCLGVSAVIHPAVWGLGTGIVARIFLVANALLCFGLAQLAMKNEGQTV